MVFLEHCYRWVTSEGVLVLVVPAPAVGTCARLLASQFDRLSVFRLEHPESIRFNQVVVFGRRKKAHLRGEPKGADELLRIAYKPLCVAITKNESLLAPTAPVINEASGIGYQVVKDLVKSWRRFRGRNSQHVREYPYNLDESHADSCSSRPEVTQAATV
jgi:hypothetical protein